MLKNGINSMAMSLTAYHEEMQQNIDQATSDLRETLEQMEIQNVELDLAEKTRAGGGAHQVGIPGQHVARAAYSAQRRDRLHPPDAENRSERDPDRLFTDHRTLGQQPADHHQRRAGLLKLEAGKLVLEHIPFALRETLDEVVVLLAPSAHDKGLELTLDVHNDVPEQVIGDSLRLQQIITNLLGNAIKFTETGNIDIRVELRKRLDRRVEVEVQIHDTGIGISERQQSQLFQAFRQADASISRRHGGTGLGLVITQNW